MSQTDPDDSPTTPPRAIRPAPSAPPVSGLRSEETGPPAPAVASANDTQLSVTEPSGRNPDTLMSLPKPVLHEELPLEARLRQLEDRLETFEARLLSAERARDPLGASRATPWWFWLLFLVGLAVTWRVLEMLR